MKKIFNFWRIALMAIVVAATMTACGDEYDDTAIWGAVEDVQDRLTELEATIARTNSDLAALQTIVNALQSNVYVTEVNTTADGYEILFSDGQRATITNGKDGEAGANAPVVSVRQDTDGNYYWTLDDEWLLVDGERVRANGEDGKDGEKGQDSTAPQVRINEQTKEWEISIDGGQSWTSTGVVAEGKDGKDGATGSAGESGDSQFREVDTSNEDYVLVTLTNGTTFQLARYRDDAAPIFSLKQAPEVIEVEYGRWVEYEVVCENVADYTISKPEGWSVDYEGDRLLITAPEKDLCHYDKEGVLAVTVVSPSGRCAIVKQPLLAGEWVDEIVLRTLTFEDGTEGFEPYECTFTYAMSGSEEYRWIEKWSDYIPRDGQYGNGHGAYEWYDEGNTELAFVKPEIESWWGISGHAGISDYVGTDEDIAQFHDGNMLFMIDLQAYNVAGGANGSQNFCSQYGYLDPDEYATQYSPQGVLPGLQFYDDEPRVIDHMYVTNTTYAYGVIVNGECDFGGSYEYTDESTFRVVAYGYDSLEDTDPTITEFYLLDTNKQIVTDWTKWDLSVLGAVVRVEFNLVACYEGYGQYGLVIPAYFAYDDVAVQFTEKVFK